MMKGLSIASLKQYPSLIPLFISVGGGCVGSLVYLLRVGLRNPDVSWIGKSEGMGNMKFPSNKKYKLMDDGRDYANLSYPEERPKI